MSESETGVIPSTGREGLSLGLQKPPEPFIHSSNTNMRLAFSADGTAIYKPLTPTSPTYQPSAEGDGATGNGGPSPLQGNKKKRGRPRKYGPPDGAMPLAFVASPESVTVTLPSGGGFTFSPAATGASTSGPAPPTPTQPPLSNHGSAGSFSATAIKKAKGRPPGSCNKQKLESLGSARFGFTPHVITVRTGEDISSKIMSFSQHGPRALCILSANGAISSATLRQPATSGGTVTYEGRYEILSLSGSFLLSENGVQRSRTGGLSVSLSGQDGQVLGGGVAGLLIAASPVQVVMGSFIADGSKESKSGHVVDPLNVTASLAPTGASSPQSHGTLSESSGGMGSPLNQSTGDGINSNPHGISSMPWK